MRGKSSAIACLLTFVAIATVAPVDAQAPGMTWYLHNMTDPVGTDSFLDFVPPNADEADNTATDDTATGSEKLTVHSEAAAPLATDLVAAGSEGNAKVWVKSWNNAPAPNVVVTMTVSADGAPIATGTSAAQDVLLGAIVEFSVPLTLSVTEVAAGTKISWDVDIQTEACGCYLPSAYPRGSSVDHPWHFFLPLAAASAVEGPVYQLLEGEIVNAAGLLEAPDSSTLIYNWTTTLSSPQIVFEATVQAGAIEVVVTDGAAAVAYSKTMDATGTDTANPEATAGTWQITVNLQGFQGSYSIVLSPVEEQDGVDSGATVDPGADPISTPSRAAPSKSLASDEPAATVDAEAKGTPGPGVALLGVVLLGLVALRRRR